ncbi:heme peroxidase family protein [Salipiger sp. P9]|uniref:peroxidase family protein n=1 Tax=Salipiger pentaromativorans TaxID=2943193 RepID=UPI00215772E4|nr:heme peroxidase family protein [Salipiger pentaromativorans]MCR8546974.1 heme peroxidase family protein [Salipiger pentaromativorans]
MTGMIHALSRYDYLVKQCLDGTALMSETPPAQHFGHLLGKPNEITGNLSHQHILDAYIALVDEMKTDQIATGPADAGMTFFGQFVDHDITLDATSSIGKKIDPRSIRNVRTPTLDLDCVYGDGPEATPHLYHPQHKDYLLFGRDACPLDLARNGKGTALIGDPRNDENILVSQIQGAFICLHNILMSHVKEGGSAADDVREMGAMSIRQSVWHETVAPRLMDFEHVRRSVRLHYQWLVLHQLLPAFVDQDCIDAALSTPHIFGPHAPIMPAEFSGAAYRFGHSTVQPSYVLKNGQPPRDLFAMMKSLGPRDPGDDMDMEMFFEMGNGRAQKALPVGTQMAETLFALPDAVVSKEERWGDLVVPRDQAKKLGLRNILRDRTTLNLASGQQVARWLHDHAPHLGIKELAAPETLKERHIDKTPLWFYCLQEADKTGKLTGVGGTIVAQVFVRLLRLDPESILNTEFTPWIGFGGSKMTMGRIMGWVEKNRDGIPLAKDLRCG